MTKKKIAHPKRSTKRAAEKPGAAEKKAQRRRAKAYKAEASLDAHAPERVVGRLREAGMDDQTIAFVLRSQGRNLSNVAEALEAKPAEPGATPPPAPAPAPWVLTGAAFNGTDELRPDCTAADLFTMLWEAPNRSGFGKSPEGFLADVLLCAADEAEILEAAMASGSDLGDPLTRYMLRAEWRFRVALEISRRMQLAAGEGSQAVVAS